MNLISTIIGLVALVLGGIGMFPLLGWMHWLVLFLAFLGMTLGLFAKGKTTGITINFFAMVFALLRLFLNGGIV